jgi:hypothetical protein
VSPGFTFWTGLSLGCSVNLSGHDKRHLIRAAHEGGSRMAKRTQKIVVPEKRRIVLSPPRTSYGSIEVATKRKTDALSKLLDNAKKLWLAPIAAGGALGVAQLGQGRYGTAILSVSTGVAMSLIILGGIVLGSVLVARLARRT